LASKLAALATSLQEYQSAYEDTENGLNHLQDYETRRSPPQSPKKRPRLDDTQEKEK